MNLLQGTLQIVDETRLLLEKAIVVEEQLLVERLLLHVSSPLSLSATARLGLVLTTTRQRACSHLATRTLVLGLDLATHFTFRLALFR